MDSNLEDGRVLSDPALVSDQAASRLAPAGFDPSRGYEPFPLPEWCVGRKPIISKERSQHKETLRRLVDRLDVAGDHEAADTIVWLMWWRNIADNRAQFFIDLYAERDSDRSGEAVETIGSTEGESAGRNGIAPTSSLSDTEGR